MHDITWFGWLTVVLSWIGAFRVAELLVLFVWGVVRDVRRDMRAEQ